MTMSAQLKNSESITECLEQANHYVACITRVSKAFTVKASMAEKNCEAIFIESFKVFLEVLSLANSEQITALNGIKQFVHRMVICSQSHIDEVFVPVLLQSVKPSSDVKLLNIVIPILTQIVQKYTKTEVVHEFIYPDLAGVCFNIWNSGKGVNDEEVQSDCKYLRRNYYNMFSVAISNQKTWLAGLGSKPDLINLLEFILDGSNVHDYNDPPTVRSSIAILNVFAKSFLMERKELAEFFVVKACTVIMSFPLSSVADGKQNLNDPQLGLALKEAAAFIQMLYEGIGYEFVEFIIQNILRNKMNLADLEIQVSF